MLHWIFLFPTSIKWSCRALETTRKTGVKSTPIPPWPAHLEAICVCSSRNFLEMSESHIILICIELLQKSLFNSTSCSGLKAQGFFWDQREPLERAPACSAACLESLPPNLNYLLGLGDKCIVERTENTGNFSEKAISSFLKKTVKFLILHLYRIRNQDFKNLEFPLVFYQVLLHELLFLPMATGIFLGAGRVSPCLVKEPGKVLFPRQPPSFPVLIPYIKCHSAFLGESVTTFSVTLTWEKSSLWQNKEQIWGGF